MRGTVIGGPNDGADDSMLPSFLGAEGEATPEQAGRVMQKTVDALELQRIELARLYSAVPGGSTAEHELGEVLTLVRKALARGRKAYGLLAQARLPLND